MNTHSIHALVAGISVMSMALLPINAAQPGLLGDDLQDPLGIEEGVALSQASSLLPISAPLGPQTVVSRIPVMVTAYSSTPDQTDDTPFITASGTLVRDGIVAANFVPLGTKVRLPDLYGDKVFLVEDRMHPRKQYMVDIWFSTYQGAKDFGAKLTNIEILAN
jgi:3D (Asp-Asp-Asp) domain-containing protein